MHDSTNPNTLTTPKVDQLISNCKLRSIAQRRVHQVPIVCDDGSDDGRTSAAPESRGRGLEETGDIEPVEDDEVELEEGERRSNEVGKEEVIYDTVCFFIY